jgi:conjugal transfer/entry exclusion protein
MVHAVHARTLALATAAALVVAPGCGSSKPGYCSDRSDLESSVQGLTDVRSVSAFQTQLKQIESDAKTLVASAKSDFPSETSAIDSSVSKLASALDALPASPSAGQLAALVPDAQAVVSAVGAFDDATSSQCD